ncbi:MAG: hypothetical protein OEN50_18120 [Deltaproteobacteria bacterium]|nr:hypothetical protein [Deltaproteobacteria bacterium]
MPDRKQRKPNVVFAIGDADWKYSRGKLRRLIDRVASENRFKSSVVSNDEEIYAAFDQSNVERFRLPGTPHVIGPQHATTLTELMIRLTRDVSFPDSRLPIWKVMAMDDYRGSLNFVPPPEIPVNPDLLVCPLMGVDNNSSAAAHLYCAALLAAHKANAPVVGLEISPLGNKQTLGASLADHYALKTEWSRQFVIHEKLAVADRAFVLPPEENYLLTCRNDGFWDDFFNYEMILRQRFSINRNRITVFIPHHVTFVYEIREILRHLKTLTFPFSVILRTDPNIARQGLKEIDIARKVYADELNALPHAVVDDEGGWMWSLLLADVVLAPIQSVCTEIAVNYGKLTVVCQGWGEGSWVGDNLYVEPRPALAVNALRSWVEQRVHHRKPLSEIIEAALPLTGFNNEVRTGWANEIQR